MITIRFAAVALAALLVAGAAPAQTAIDNPRVTPEELREHIRFLASDSLKGRKVGTPENERAARYIADRFKEYGLVPAGDAGSFLQSFPFVSGAKPGTGNALSLTTGGRTLRLGHDTTFRTLAISSDTTIDAGIVFAGYGITDTSQGYDDYGGIDATGKVVIVLRFTPKGDDPHSPFVTQSSLRQKAFRARERGAAALLIVTGPLDAEKPELASFSFDQGVSSSGIAVASIGWDTFDSLLSAEGKTARGVQEAINTSQKPASFALRSTAALTTAITKITGSSMNVLGVLPGSDPSLKDQYIVLGAHFDHLGMGGTGSLAPDTVAVHHGADDNASGTAGLIEAAEYLAAHRDSLRRSILFAGFSGEEAGLLGSSYFVAHPTVPAGSMRAMLNMDMIGRMRDGKLVVEGIGTSPGFDSLVRAANHDSALSLTMKPDGYGPSDHAAFYGKDIPVLFFFTNMHSDYHKPSDTWDKINYDGEAQIVNFVVGIATGLDRADAPPAFVRVASSAGDADRRPMRATMGVVPDYADEGGGLKVNGVRPGGPAEKAGIQAGDLIVKFADKTVSNVYDYTYILQEHGPGDVVSVEVKRGEKLLTMTVTLTGR